MIYIAIDIEDRIYRGIDIIDICSSLYTDIIYIAIDIIYMIHIAIYVIHMIYNSYLCTVVYLNRVLYNIVYFKQDVAHNRIQ